MGGNSNCLINNLVSIRNKRVNIKRVQDQNIIESMRVRFKVMEEIIGDRMKRVK